MVIMGGMNTWSPVRNFVPTNVDTPLLSNDVRAIRKHYELKCNEGKFQLIYYTVFALS